MTAWTEDVRRPRGEPLHTKYGKDLLEALYRRLTDATGRVSYLLSPGSYEVSTTGPGGEIVVRSVEVRPGGSTSLMLP